MKTKDSLRERFKSRCVLKRDELPKTWCPSAVNRLKWIRGLGHEPSEEEEATAAFCPWAIDNQLAGYCWFRYEAQQMSENAVPDNDIAAALNISVDTVKKTTDRAIAKIKDSKEIKEIRDNYGTEAVISQDYSRDDETVYCE